jgi:hypothetical protein
MSANRRDSTHHKCVRNPETATVLINKPLQDGEACAYCLPARFAQSDLGFSNSYKNFFFMAGQQGTSSQ